MNHSSMFAKHESELTGCSARRNPANTSSTDVQCNSGHLCLVKALSNGVFVQQHNVCYNCQDFPAIHSEALLVPYREFFGLVPTIG